MKVKKLIAAILVFILLPVFASQTQLTNNAKINYTCSVDRGEAMPVIASKENPFYALIATPVALYYDEYNNQHVKPLLVENFSNPSDAIIRFKEMYGLRDSEAIIIENKDVVEASIEIAEQIWNRASEAIIVKNDLNGYSIAVNLLPLASYKGIPVFVANELQQIMTTLKQLGVRATYVCGDIEGYGNVIKFESGEEARDYVIDYVKERFGNVGYIVITNPEDIRKPEVLSSVEYNFRGKTGSLAILPAQSLHGVLTRQFFGMHEFEVPNYKYARIKIELFNLNSENVKELGDDIFLMILSPDGIPLIYTATGAGLAEYDESGDIVLDKVNYEFIVGDSPGVYKARVMGRWFADVEGEYELKIKVEEIDSPIDPLMESLSSLAAYLAAYRHGIVWASADFSFAGEKGMSQPGDNPYIRDECNEHVMKIHEELNELLARIADLPDDLKTIWQHYRKNPIYIAIMADATMVPMYYYKNPDDGYIAGWGVPGDYIYGDVDVRLDDTENDTFTYYPFQENAVGRITGYDAEDVSALIARTIFYEKIIDVLGEWKNNATVQTGCGLEFQWIPVITTLSNLLLGTNDPTKWPSGESFFINLRLCHDLESGGFNVKRTHLLASQREGFDDLARYGRKYFLFPRFYEAISGNKVVKGGKYQEESNIIFVFNHGFYFLYESGDVLMDARGFPPFTTLSRFYPMGSGLSSKGAYYVRNVYKMDFGPGIIFVESCITGRIDGLAPENCLSQAYLHAGMNGYIGATRVTADPGYLEPGLIFDGFGLWGFINATLNLKLHGKYPEPHFGAVVAEDFILDLIQNDSTTGMALRNAKNKYLPKDANSTFMWTPPLISSDCWIIDKEIYESLNPKFEYGKYLDKKYHCLHEFNLYGDPAFNPWNP
ncbi:MAG: hypothetical protein J7L58_06620 [Thermoplasmata archaeon]|nr:hypothetical protein [Thermoplasmata archaeon]